MTQATLIASLVRIALVTNARMYTVVTGNALEDVLTMTEYIKREAAIEALSRGDGCGNICRRGIERIPSADVAPVRHGRWIEYMKVIIPEPYNKLEQAWKCSECGFDDGFITDHFCPNCGAKMDKEEE